jgi:hypothetical protein
VPWAGDASFISGIWDVFDLISPVFVSQHHHMFHISGGWQYANRFTTLPSREVISARYGKSNTVGTVGWSLLQAGAKFAVDVATEGLGDLALSALAAGGTSSASGTVPGFFEFIAHQPSTNHTHVDDRVPRAPEAEEFMVNMGMTNSNGFQHAWTVGVESVTSLKSSNLPEPFPAAEFETAGIYTADINLDLGPSLPVLDWSAGYTGLETDIGHDTHFMKSAWSPSRLGANWGFLRKEQIEIVTADSVGGWSGTMATEIRKGMLEHTGTFGGPVYSAELHMTDGNTYDFVSATIGNRELIIAFWNGASWLVPSWIS